MQIDKAQIIELLKSQGKDDKVSQAESELPDKVDTDEHAGLLDKLGINVGDLVGKLGGGALGGLGGLGG
jgi:F0F1-type ATP synthase membrane subunit b/b'